MSVDARNKNDGTLNPTPFRPTKQQSDQLADLSDRTGMAKSAIVRRCIEFALPLLESGAVPMVEVKPESAAQEVGA